MTTQAEPREVTPAAIAAYLERTERRQRELEAGLRRLEAELQEARRDPLADLVTTVTFCKRYDVSMHQLRHWLDQRASNGFAACIRQHTRKGAIWIDLAAFHRWFEERYKRPRPTRRQKNGGYP